MEEITQAAGWGEGAFQVHVEVSSPPPLRFSLRAGFCCALEVSLKAHVFKTQSLTVGTIGW